MRLRDHPLRYREAASGEIENYFFSEAGGGSGFFSGAFSGAAFVLTFRASTGNCVRSAISTSRAAAVQKVLPVMQCWPAQLPSLSWAFSRPAVIFASQSVQSLPPLM